MSSIMIMTAAFGVLAGEVADFVFDWLNEKNVEGNISLLHWFEHYHWGMILFCLYSFASTYLSECPSPLCIAIRHVTDSPFLIGFGLSLILDENRSDTRFAWRKNPDQYYHFYESSMLGIGLGIVTLSRWLTSSLTSWAIIVVIVLLAVYILLHKEVRERAKPVFPHIKQLESQA
jgi:hypothetical protein